MSAEELRRRITDAPPPLTAALLAELRAIPHVTAVREAWFHGWVEITVVLDDWVWPSWDYAHNVIDSFAREHIEKFSIVGHVEVPENVR